MSASSRLETAGRTRPSSEYDELADCNAAAVPGQDNARLFEALREGAVSGSGTFHADAGESAEEFAEPLAPAASEQPVRLRERMHAARGGDTVEELVDTLVKISDRASVQWHIGKDAGQQSGYDGLPERPLPFHEMPRDPCGYSSDARESSHGQDVRPYARDLSVSIESGPWRGLMVRCHHTEDRLQLQLVAGNQEMHDLLLAHQHELGANLSRQLGIDVSLSVRESPSC